MKRLAPLIILFGSELFFLIATYFSFTMWQDRIRVGVDSEKWPTSPATFMSGTVARVGNAKDSTPYQPRIRYSYTVSGVTQFSDAIASASPSFRTREQAQTYIDSYPKDNLLAHYNPVNPAEAVLETGISFAWYLLLIIPVFTGATALFLLFQAVKMVRKNGAQEASI